jgi:hypothetical protein
MTTTVNSEPREDGAFLVWDHVEIAKAHAAEMLEGNPTLDPDDAFNSALADRQLFINEYDYLLMALTDLMGRMNPESNWVAKVENFGWQKLDGKQEFHADNGGDFLKAILPDTECNFKIFVRGEGDDQHFAINNTHHDSPVWGVEWYYVRKA